MLAAGPHAMERSGRVLGVDALAKAYGLADVNGTRPMMRVVVRNCATTYETAERSASGG